MTWTLPGHFEQENQAGKPRVVLFSSYRIRNHPYQSTVHTIVDLLLETVNFFFFFSKYLLPFLQHICHVATAILTDTEGSGCHFWVLFGDWAPQASLHFLMSACKCHLQKLPAPATWVFASQNPPPNCLLSYSPDPGICSCTMSFKIAAIEPYSIFGLFLPFFDGWFTYTHYFINC